MKLQNVTIKDRMVSTHLLTIELAVPPEARISQRLFEFPMNQQGHIEDTIATTHCKRAILVGGFPGRFGIHSDDLQRLE